MITSQECEIIQKHRAMYELVRPNRLEPIRLAKWKIRVLSTLRLITNPFGSSGSTDSVGKMENQIRSIQIYFVNPSASFTRLW